MTFIKPFGFLLISMAIVLGLGCQKEPSPKSNSLSFFKEFKFEIANNPQLSSDITINLAEVDVKATQADVEYIGMNSFVPTFSVPTGAKVYVNNVEQQSGVTSQDFLNTVEYKVVSESGDEQIYKITINYTSTDFKITPEGAISGKNTDINIAVIGEYMNGVRVTAIAKGGFIRYTSLTKLRLPNSLENIEDYAFYKCSGLSGDLIIPNSVKSIGDAAFYKCKGFRGTLTLSDSLKSIGYGAFADCSKFSGRLTLPDALKSIGASAFEDCRGFTGDLTIPSSVDSIGNNTFNRCIGLSGDLIIPSSVTSIGVVAFNGCKGFTGKLSLPNSITTIGDGAFNECSGFTGDLTIPNSVDSIGDGAFANCSGFTGKLSLPNSITTIKGWTFYGCRGFTGDLTIPNSVDSIGRNAFKRCSGFTGTLTIPSSVKSIGDGAFYDCSGFTKRCNKSSDTTLSMSTFYMVTSYSALCPPLLSDNNLLSCSVNLNPYGYYTNVYDVDIHPTEPTGTLILPYGSESSIVKVKTIKVSDKAKASLSVGSIIKVSDKTFKIAVSAEDSSVKNYTITIIVGLNTKANITAFKFGEAKNSQITTDVEATIVKDTIKATFPFGTNPNLTLIPTFTLSGGATAKVKDVEQSSDSSKQDFSTDVKYVVTSQDGKTTKTYVVKIFNTDADITAFKFEASNNTQITTTDLEATIANDTIRAVLPFGTNPNLTLIPTFTLSDRATVKVKDVEQSSGSTSHDFSTDVKYVVTSQDGKTTKTYVVKVLNSDAYITAFKFEATLNNTQITTDVEATITNNTINATVPYDTDSKMIPTFTLSTGASVKVGTVSQISGSSKQDFSTDVQYVVTAQDGKTTKTYVVKVLNSVANITAFKFEVSNNTRITTDVEATITNDTINANVPYGTNSTLIPTFTLSTGASVKVGTVSQISGSSNQNFSTNVKYVVTSQDGTTTKTYVVKVLNSSTNITAFKFEASNNNTQITTDVEATITNNTINATVPYDTNSKMIPTFTLSTGASVKVGTVSQISGSSKQDFSTDVQYVVTAQDGTTTKTYVVKVLNSVANIIAFKFEASNNNTQITTDVEATITNDTINATVPYDTKSIMIPTFTLSTGASVKVGAVSQSSGSSNQNFSTNVKYVVTSQDGTTTKTYVVKVLNSVANITAFKFEATPKNTQITTDVEATITNNTINANVPYDTASKMIPTFTLSTGASVKVGTVSQISGSSKQDFSTDVQYVVTAQDGTTTKTYVVKVLNSSTNIIAFKFEKTNNPTLNESSDITFDLTANPTQANVQYIGQTSFVPTFSVSSKAKVYVNDVEQGSGVTSQDFLNTVTYKVVAQSGATQIYKIAINYTSSDFTVTTGGAITGSPALTTAVIGEYMNGVRVRQIPVRGFQTLKSLTKLRLPNSLDSIGGYAFANCDGFTGDLTIPNSVKSIGELAFYECKGFNGTLTIPSSVTSIGRFAFYDCDGFTKLCNNSTATGQGAFDNVTTNTAGCP